MRRLWNWLFPKRNIIRPFAHVWPGMAAVIAEYRPELLSEFNSFGNQSPSVFAEWLDQHFPRADMRWGLTSFERAPANLRDYLEQAR